MPSGAKKRKAAKKKKEKAALQVNHKSKNHQVRGNDDPRSQDERESDDGVSSEASHDHDNHQNPFTEGIERSKKTNTSRDQSFVTDSESVKEVSDNTEATDKAALNNEDAIKIERELKHEENREITDSSVEHDRSSSSSSSSSDAESQGMKKKTEKGKANISAFEVITYSDVDTLADSLAEKAMQVTGNAPLPDASVNSILETVPLVDSTKPVGSAAEEQIHVEGIPDEILVVPDVKRVSAENEEKSLLKLYENAQEDFPLSNGNPGASSGVTDSDVKEHESKRLSLSDPVSEPNNNEEGVKESEFPESSEKEPLVGSTHHVVRRTSWLSCCGIFDV